MDTQTPEPTIASPSPVKRFVRSHKTQLVLAIVLLALTGYFVSSAVGNIMDRSNAKKVQPTAVATTSDAPDTDTAKTAEVTIEKGGVGSSLLITPGTTVVWKNIDSVAHTLKSDSFGTTTIEAGATFSYAFSQPGDYVVTDGTNKSTVTVKE